VDGDRPGVCAPTGYEKSLIGLPWRYAFRCTDELGLKLRAEVIWAKVNGTPESVQDRVRRSHEHFFHFTKQEKYYYATNDIRIPYLDEGFAANGQKAAKSGTAYSNERLSTGYDMGEDITANPLGRLPGSVWEIASEPLQIPDYLRGSTGAELDHYAAYPTALVRPVIKGFSPKAICTVCGEGRFPVTVSSEPRRHGRSALYGATQSCPDQTNGTGASTLRQVRDVVTVGYACKCTPYTDHPERRGNGWHEHADDLGKGQTQNHSRRDLGGAIPMDGGQVRANGVRAPQGPVREYHLDSWTPPPSTRGVVVDPFGGAGTTALVAVVHGRDGISSDLSKDYARIAAWRVQDGAERARALGVKKTPKKHRVHEALYGDLFGELDELMK
jgi:DNA modification methylase